MKKTTSSNLMPVIEGLKTVLEQDRNALAIETVHVLEDTIVKLEELHTTLSTTKDDEERKLLIARMCLDLLKLLNIHDVYDWFNKLF